MWFARVGADGAQSTIKKPGLLNFSSPGGVWIDFKGT